MNPNSLEVIATLLFAAALIHTFSVKALLHWARKFPQGSVAENLLHLLGEVEVVFGFWAGIFLVIYRFMRPKEELVVYLEKLNFTEPAFVFAIMAVAATKPVLQLAEIAIRLLARLLPLRPRAAAFYVAILFFGPLLGSFITEPAAMTVTALILKAQFYDKGLSRRFMYSTMGILFVNVSVGGTLTPFAAPPVLMVASKWNWDTAFMMSHFGWKMTIAVGTNAFLGMLINLRELRRAFPAASFSLSPKLPRQVPYWVMAAHAFFLAFVAVNSHHMPLFMGAFLFFLGFVTVCAEYNDSLKLKESLLVAFFLGGLVVLGNLQNWWIYPLVTSLESGALFIGATLLTAITDNAALTYLGSQAQGLSDVSKYALVAGAVAGGGLTVIANAPNPAGYSILNPSFGEEGISPVVLLLAALVPTLIALSFLLLQPGWL